MYILYVIIQLKSGKQLGHVTLFSSLFIIILKSYYCCLLISCFVSFPDNFNRVKLNRCGKNSVYDTIDDACPSDFINASYFNVST